VDGVRRISMRACKQACQTAGRSVGRASKRSLRRLRRRQQQSSRPVSRLDSTQSCWFVVQSVTTTTLQLLSVRVGRSQSLGSLQCASVRCCVTLRCLADFPVHTAAARPASLHTRMSTPDYDVIAVGLLPVVALDAAAVADDSR